MKLVNQGSTIFLIRRVKILFLFRSFSHLYLSARVIYDVAGNIKDPERANTLEDGS